MTPEEVWLTVTQFVRLPAEEARLAYALGEDARDWKVTHAQEDVRQSGPDRELIQPVVYRPFDVRYTCYTGQSRGFIGQPQQRITGQLLGRDNVALSTARNVEPEGFSHAFVVDRLTTHHTVSVKEVSYVFPLHLYSDTAGHHLFSHTTPATERRPNLNATLVSALAEAHGQQPTPEEIFHCVYAILYAPSYREKYADFLKTDFRRIPFTRDRDGSRYFAPVPPDLWEYRIGGHQVLEKWLKDRPERQLSLAETGPTAASSARR